MLLFDFQRLGIALYGIIILGFAIAFSVAGLISRFTNLEGKIQKAYKASYPPGDAKEDWQIINELAELMNNRKLFNDKDELESSMLNYLNLEKEKQINVGEENTITDENEFKSETLNIVVKDYYFSNVIARSSKTMVECNNSKLNLKSTGTEG